MTHNAILSCSCGRTKASLSGYKPAQLNHVFCHCNDCQAFAKFLGAQARYLDANGGTRICQISGARVSLDEGIENLVPLRLSPKGLLRWHAKCCNSPMFNTLASRGLPFVGVIAQNIELEGKDFEDVLGPMLGRGFLKHATGDTRAIEHQRLGMGGYMARFGRIMLASRLRGDHKRTPFFAADGTPIAAPFVIGLAEKERLYP